ncbi:MAG: histidine kinase, partial [Xanthomonadales bacterium]|nr:histidine kinase [Xanthomonadales bacterium]
SRHSTAPILLIVVIAQAPFCLGVRGTVALMAVVNIAMLMIIWKVWGADFTEALLSTLLYGTFQLFALLVGSFAISAEKARLELTEVNAELMATRSLLVESARDRERLRLSRELHDVAGHTLSALKLNLRTLTRETDGESQQLAEQSLELAENLLGDVRALVGNFRSNDGLAIDGAIEQLTAPFQTPRFEIEIDPDTRIEDLDVARTLIAVAREAITNVVRHANAGVCRIAVNRTDQRLRMIVEDDGDGVKDAHPGQGLRGMKERMRALGGSLAVEAVASGGTRVIATVGAQA